MRALSAQTKLYLIAMYIAGFTILMWNINRMASGQTWQIIALGVLASLSLILKVEGSTNRSHYSFNFLFYGFTFAVLGTAEALLVIVVSNLIEWIWNKPPWYIQLFNTSCYIVVMQLAGLAYALVNPGLTPNTWQTALGIFLGMLVFDVLNHLLVGFVILLARGETFKQSGIFDIFPLVLDLALLTFGASLSFVWKYNPAALLLFLIPIYLIYSTLRVPALERKSEIDSKTGLFNHEYFKKHLYNELARANRFDRPLSVIIADLDLLRNINNTYGHLAGDEVLIGIAHSMKKAVRDYDVVCRFGGEEFAILLPETTLAQAFERAEIIRQTVEAMEFTIATSMTPIRATLSLGIAHRENFSQSPENITHNADLALYHSKLSGRNRSFGYSSDTYVEFLNGNLEPAHILPGETQLTPELVLAQNPAVQQKALADKGQANVSKPAPEADPKTVSASERSAKGSKRRVNLFIGGLAVLAVVMLALMTSQSPLSGLPRVFDWWGLLAIVILIALSEGFSVDLYLKQTSVSTSAIPILGAYLLFGTTGILVASLALAISLLAKFRSPFSRFIFNLSNHLLAGALILGLVSLTGSPFLELSTFLQIFISLSSGIILYGVSTWMVSVGMSLDLEQSARQIWKEQFSWLAPYYLGVGLITYALIFGYKHDHIVGLILMIIPMLFLRISQKQYIDRTREVVAELREKNQILKKNSEEMSDVNEGLLLTLSEIIDLRDPYVLGHSRQVSQYATEIARLLGLNEKQVDLIRRAGLLHDIGKLGIPMEILAKPGKLTHAEYEVIQTHSALGGDLIKHSPSLRPLVTIIRHHHEFYNGKGYPDHIAGNQIALEARIVAVADAIEAMMSDRPYRKAFKTADVIEELNRFSGTQFDPLVTKQAINMLTAILAAEGAAADPSDSIRMGHQLKMNMQAS
jgi:diguanylate cyclase (GGDEF)-like protein/putative nucleotidyltransferase with HDIG domain